MIKNTKNEDESSKLNSNTDWVADLKSPNLSKNEKIELIKVKAEAMETKAKYFESGSSHNN
jgi:hypothetical protein